MIASLLILLIAQPAVNWPQFRGPQASGIADGQNLPIDWNVATGQHIAWKQAVAGLAHASPIIWDGRVYVATAVSSLGRANLKHGLYGSGDADADRSPHQWRLLCFALTDGSLLFDRLVTEGVPIDKRHIKATYANSTPATDGSYLVTWFGSQGLFCLDMQGQAIWQKDLGRLDMGAYDAPTYEWGPASSPIIFDGKVIVQCDTQTEDFVAAFDLATGEQRWRTARDELPSWGTPTVFTGRHAPELLTNGSHFVRAYDPKSGAELWRIGGSSQITAPTPVFEGEFAVVTSGRRPEKPIFVIKAGGRGDLTDSANADDHLVWRKTGKGPYMPTPLVQNGYLYTLQNQGILDCYRIENGEEVYRQRLPHSGGGFSASPVAADGRLYLPGEDGDLFVIKMGPEYELLARHDFSEVIMATPAIAAGTLIVRGRDHLWAIRQSNP